MGDMADPASREPVSVAAYLAEEHARAEKHVLWDGETFAMAGGTPTHNLLVAAVLRELGVRLRGRPCQPYGSDQRIGMAALLRSRSGARRYVYPDASVICKPTELDPEDPDTIVNPTLVVEVLSESTEAFDRGEKFVAYRGVPSLSDYLLVSQTSVRIEHYVRQDDAGWVLRTYGPGQTIVVRSLGIELPVDDLYEGVLEPQS
jgi:Uma2 family endonuclease